MLDYFSCTCNVHEVEFFKVYTEGGTLPEKLHHFTDMNCCVDISVRLCYFEACCICGHCNILGFNL